LVLPLGKRLKNGIKIQFTHKPEREQCGESYQHNVKKWSKVDKSGNKIYNFTKQELNKKCPHF
jgi:hypothetical protein